MLRAAGKRLARKPSGPREQCCPAGSVPWPKPWMYVCEAHGAQFYTGTLPLWDCRAPGVPCSNSPEHVWLGWKGVRCLGSGVGTPKTTIPNSVSLSKVLKHACPSLLLCELVCPHLPWASGMANTSYCVHSFGAAPGTQEVLSYTHYY